MKKLLIAFMLLTAAAFAQTQPQYTVSVGTGFNSYVTPSNFGYLAFSKPIGANSYSVTTVELLGQASRMRSGFAHDLASQGPATLFALGDAGIATAPDGGVGFNVAGGGGIKVKASGIPLINKFIKSDNVGFVGTVMLNKQAVQNVDGSTGVQPSFTGGIYIKFGQ